MTPWAVELLLLALRDLGINPPGLKFKGEKHTVGGFLPAPGDFLATFIIFAPLAVMAETKAKNLATAIGWAYVLATLLGALDPADPLGVGSKPQTTTPQGRTSNGS